MIDSKRSIFSWAMYDWANSAFSTTVMAGFFPLFFKVYWADPNDIAQSTFYLGMVNSVSAIAVAIMAPLLGAIADRGTAKKKFLFLFAFLGIVMTGSLWLVSSGYWQMALLVYLLATIGFAGGNIFYDSLLPGVASQKQVDYASSIGFALGYIGGGLLFSINVILYLRPDFFGLADSSLAVRVSFISVALWWALFSLPLLFCVEEPRLYQPVKVSMAVKLGLRQLKDTAHEIKQLRKVGLFLLAYWLYIDGVHTIIRMSVDFGISLGFSGSSLIIALLMVQFIAFPATLFYGWWASRIGTKEAILTGIFGYCLITFLGYFMNMVWHFYVLAAMIGLFQGGIQALSRSLYTRIIPAEKSAEFFGFYNMMGKFAAVIGPGMMGAITLITGNIRYGILSILFLFIAGAYFLWKVSFDLNDIEGPA